MPRSKQKGCELLDKAVNSGLCQLCGRDIRGLGSIRHEGQARQISARPEFLVSKGVDKWSEECQRRGVTYP